MPVLRYRQRDRGQVRVRGISSIPGRNESVLVLTAGMCRARGRDRLRLLDHTVCDEQMIALFQKGVENTQRVRNVPTRFAVLEQVRKHGRGLLG